MTEDEFLSALKPKPFLRFQEYNFDARLSFVIKTAKVLCPGFTLTEYNRSLYENGIKYFSGDPSSRFPLNRGLLVCGPTGTGKSFFFDVMKAMHKGCKTGNDFRIIRINELVSGLSGMGYNYFTESGIEYSSFNVRYYETKHVLLDDVGLSEDTVNHFGSKIDIALNFFQRRYNAFMEQAALTFVTTNIKPDLFAERFGDVVDSRINQMFEIIELRGKDYRKLITKI